MVWVDTESALVWYVCKEKKKDTNIQQSGSVVPGQGTGRTRLTNGREAMVNPVTCRISYCI